MRLNHFAIMIQVLFFASVSAFSQTKGTSLKDIEDANIKCLMGDSQPSSIARSVYNFVNPGRGNGPFQITTDSTTIFRWTGPYDSYIQTRRGPTNIENQYIGLQILGGKFYLYVIAKSGESLQLKTKIPYLSASNSVRVTDSFGQLQKDKTRVWDLLVKNDDVGQLVSFENIDSNALIAFTYDITDYRKCLEDAKVRLSN